MKKRYFSIAVLFTLSFLLYSFVTNESKTVPQISFTSSSNHNISDNFIFGMMNDEPHDFQSPIPYGHINSIGANMSHSYNVGAMYVDPVTQRGYPKGRVSDDGVLNPINDYKTEVRTMLDNIYTANNNRRFLFSRPKIEWLCRGQSSVYECESVNSGALWFYSFNDHIGVDSSNHTARFCKVGDSPGYVVKRLKANTEQCNRSISNDNPWLGDSQCEWYVKPRIKIPASYPSLHPTDTICKIEVIMQDGTTNKLTTIIRARDFLDQNNIYSGNYLDTFNFESGRNELIFTGDLGDNWINSARGTCASDAGVTNKADIRVYWTGACDMWIDYVKVENDVAQELFNGDWDLRIRQEDSLIGRFKPSVASKPVISKYYIELTEFNNLPCIKYVNDKLAALANGRDTIDVMADYTITNLVHVKEGQRGNMTTPEWIYNNYVLRGGFKQFFTEVYPMRSEYKTNGVYTDWFSKIPNSLPDLTTFPLATPVSPDAYDTWLQDNIDHSPFQIEEGGSGGGQPIIDLNSCNSTLYQVEGEYRYVMKMGNYMANHNVPFILMGQGHMWYRPGEVRREPTNEEIEMLANIAISYGAKGLMYFQFNSDDDGTGTCPNYSRGLQKRPSDAGYPDLLENNLYNQDTAKWKILRRIGKLVKKWEPYIMNFDSVKSYYYGNSSDNTALFNTYFNQLITYKPTSSACYDAGSPSSTYTECPEERYVQVGMFDKTSENNTKYFMVVNRRCAPETTGFVDGRRFVRVKFDANAEAFNGFNNWKIIDLEDNSTVLTFDKRAASNLDLDWFDPGQGKLYKVVPVMKYGGTFIGDESFSSVSFNFNSPVNTNGKNLTIGGGVHIFFKDTCRLEMNGGNFICGTYTDDEGNPKSVELYEQSGSWRGIVLQNMDTVVIQNTAVRSVDSAAAYNDTVGIYMKHGISILNTEVINIDNCNIFNMSSSSAGIFLYYNLNVYMNPEINITRNNIQIRTGNYEGIYIHPYSWLTLTPYIYKNRIINTSSNGGKFGIFGFSLEGTAIKNNYIKNFKNGIQTWYSSIDLFENSITTSNISNGYPLNGIVSEYNLSNAYESRLGGSNVLKTLDGQCIHLDALDLNIGDGNNIFTINDSLAYHLAGYFPIPKPNDDKLNGAGNCFKIGAYSIPSEDVRENVTWSDLNPIVYDYGTQICPGEPNYCDYYIGGNPNDTVWIECGGGMSGGQKDNYESRVTNYKLSAPQENVYKQIYDSLSINMRKKQYGLAAEKCMTLLDNYPDSAKTINAVDKLYRTALARDEVSELKSYFESFIQSHPNHTQIIQRMFYYIQKAKAKLGQYESAMQGFQTIMNQFPTSYEGLAAKWDYMATQLLDSLNGQGGGEKKTISDEQLTDEQRHERLVSLVEDPLDKYDKKKFSKEDRKVIVTNIVNSFEGKKTKEANRYKELETKMNMGKANSNEKQEYKTKKVLKEVVRPQRVNTISEHISAVQTDIKRIFNIEKSTDDSYTKMANSIPGEYKLNQNYPNPFNPSTKINYELKNAGYVSLKIYDLLGREIAELVNETKDAGRYAVDFNASKYMMASGIYFYRIKAGEFTDTKRMVLVK